MFWQFYFKPILKDSEAAYRIQEVEGKETIFEYNGQNSFAPWNKAQR